MNATLLRQDGVATSNTDLETQTSTLTFKPGKAIDFRKLAKAVDTAGFTVGEIRVWVTGQVEIADGQVLFKVGGSDQIFLLVDNEAVVKLKAAQGRRAKVIGRVQFKETPVTLVIESVEM